MQKEFMRSVTKKYQRSVNYFYAIDGGEHVDGFYHVHVLILTDCMLDVLSIRRSWRRGYTGVQRYDAWRGAAWYLSKGLRADLDLYTIWRTMPPPLSKRPASMLGSWGCDSQLERHEKRRSLNNGGDRQGAMPYRPEGRERSASPSATRPLRRTPSATAIRSAMSRETSLTLRSISFIVVRCRPARYANSCCERPASARSGRMARPSRWRRGIMRQSPPMPQHCCTATAMTGLWRHASLIVHLEKRDGNRRLSSAALRTGNTYRAWHPLTIVDIGLTTGASSLALETCLSHLQWVQTAPTRASVELLVSTTAGVALSAVGVPRVHICRGVLLAV